MVLGAGREISSFCVDMGVYNVLKVSVLRWRGWANLPTLALLSCCFSGSCAIW